MRRSAKRLTTLPVAIAVLAALPSAAFGSKLAVSPAPGTPDASPQTQISILGVAPKSIRSVRVAGATSGAHRGHLRFYSGGRGASFLLSQPLTQGERVTVDLRVRGRAPKRWSFTVARLGAAQPFLNFKVFQQDKLQQFVTEPGLQPPKIATLKRSSGAGGDIFI